MSKQITDRVYPRGDIQRCITSKYASINSTGVLRDVVLYQHQCVIIAAMINIEKVRKYKLSNGDVVFTTSALLSEPGGSGKTFICLALITLQPEPTPFPMVYGVSAADPQSTSFTVTKKLTGGDARIASTLIVVGTSVFEQWRYNITERMNKLVLGVKDYHSMRTFQALHERKAISRYPIVLMRNAPMTGEFVIGGKKIPNQSRSSLEVMHMLTAGNVWNRVIIDDYDTIGIPLNAPTPNSLFTWYVSASRKTQADMISCKTVSISTQLTEQPTVLQTLRCPLVNGIYNLRVSTKFRRASKSIPIVKFYKYMYANPDDNYIRALHGINDEAAREMVQMLNGDAIGEAAARVGIQATSVADIFKKMLDDKYDAFILAKKQLAFAKVQRDELDYVEEAFDDEGRQKGYSANALEKIRARILKMKDPEIKYFAPPLLDLFDAIMTEAKKEVEKTGKAIDRMIENIRLGGCQRCKLDLDKDTSVFIIKCCGLVICSICFPKACKLGVHYDRNVRGAIHGAKCAQCLRFLDMKQDLIFLDRDFDIERLLSASGDEGEQTCSNCGCFECECKEEEEDIPEVIDDLATIKNPKVRALLEIIRGQKPENRKEFTRTNMVLMEGDEYIPQPTDIKKKVLVFAHYEETLDLVTEQLIAFNIKFLRIGGNADEVYQTLQRFRKGDYTVLLINSSQRCAGMSMEFVTDEVFMHEVLDKHVAGQLAARAQRYGRETSLNIHYLCYHNEGLLH